MNKNMKNADCIIRLGIGILIITPGIVNQSLLGEIGLIPLFTTGIGLCLLYKILS